MKKKFICGILIMAMMISSSAYALTVLDDSATWNPVINGVTYTHTGHSHLNSNNLIGNADTATSSNSTFARKVESNFTYYDSSTKKTYVETLSQYRGVNVPLDCKVTFSVPNSTSRITNIDTTHKTYYNGTAYTPRYTHCSW